ncbi:hypothetical protein DENSPDRAFT_854325 [Dentipellis sp. KUC8613]|nr:hypothetical protein DENSPDRAFT_854325 [Dentipellis sp. KUC8613]
MSNSADPEIKEQPKPTYGEVVDLDHSDSVLLRNKATIRRQIWPAQLNDFGDSGNMGAQFRQPNVRVDIKTPAQTKPNQAPQKGTSALETLVNTSEEVRGDGCSKVERLEEIIRALLPGKGNLAALSAQLLASAAEQNNMTHFNKIAEANVLPAGFSEIEREAFLQPLRYVAMGDAESAALSNYG